MSASNLYDNIKKQLKDKWQWKLELSEFRSKAENEESFWNLIYYFNEYRLPYEFILPYKDKKFEKYLKSYEN